MLKIIKTVNRETSTGGLTTVSWILTIPEISVWALTIFLTIWTQLLPSLPQVTMAKRRCIFSKVQSEFVLKVTDYLCQGSETLGTSAQPMAHYQTVCKKGFFGGDVGVPFHLNTTLTYLSQSHWPCHFTACVIECDWLWWYNLLLKSCHCQNDLTVRAHSIFLLSNIEC